MVGKKLKIFISHTSDEKSEVNRAKAYLEKSFGDDIETFSASTWDSIPPGDDWFARIQDGINSADIVLVFASPDSISRPWINFETGAAWMQKKKVIPVCWNGMTPNALPEPICRLQAVDVNSPKPLETYSKIVEAVRKVGELQNQNQYLWRT